MGHSRTIYLWFVLPMGDSHWGFRTRTWQHGREIENFLEVLEIWWRMMRCPEEDGPFLCGFHIKQALKNFKMRSLKHFLKNPPFFPEKFFVLLSSQVDSKITTWKSHLHQSNSSYFKVVFAMFSCFQISWWILAVWQVADERGCVFAVMAALNVVF